MRYLALSRFYTVVPLALLSYGIGKALDVPPLELIAGTMAIAFAVSGGYAYNDLRDQACDRVNRPARPLASGRLTRVEVARFTAVAFGAAILLATATLSVATIGFVALLVLSGVLYSDAVKRMIGLKNAFVGAWCGMLPWGASLDRASVATVLAAAAIIGLFVTQKELVADVYDRDGDAAAGIRTIPVAMGQRIGLALVAALNVSLFMLARHGPVPPLPYLRETAVAVAMVNAASLCVVALRITSFTVRAYLELQKVFLIGGCIGLFAAIAAHR